MNPNWELGNMLAVSAGEDRVVKLWNIEDCSCKCVHNAHTVSNYFNLMRKFIDIPIFQSNSDKLIGACFAGNDKIVSVSENGFITIWRTLTNEITPLKNVFPFKVQITTLATCPHSPWLVAFGVRQGLVIITDLRSKFIIIDLLSSYLIVSVF